jgi:hypothetical protein
MEWPGATLWTTQAWTGLVHVKDLEYILIHGLIWLLMRLGPDLHQSAKSTGQTLERTSQVAPRGREIGGFAPGPGLHGPRCRELAQIVVWPPRYCSLCNKAALFLLKSRVYSRASVSIAAASGWRALLPATDSWVCCQGEARPNG